MNVRKLTLKRCYDLSKHLLKPLKLYIREVSRKGPLRRRVVVLSLLISAGGFAAFLAGEPAGLALIPLSPLLTGYIVHLYERMKRLATERLYETFASSFLNLFSLCLSVFPGNLYTALRITAASAISPYSDDMKRLLWRFVVNGEEPRQLVLTYASECPSPTVRCYLPVIVSVRGVSLGVILERVRDRVRGFLREYAKTIETRITLFLTFSFMSTFTSVVCLLIYGFKVSSVILSSLLHVFVTLFLFKRIFGKGGLLKARGS